MIAKRMQWAYNEKHYSQKDIICDNASSAFKEKVVEWKLVS